jgi:hypothetical protein
MKQHKDNEEKFNKARKEDEKYNRVEDTHKEDHMC